MKKFFILFLFCLLLVGSRNFSAFAEEENSKPLPPVITNEKLREYKDFIAERGIKEKEIPDLKQIISAHSKDKNYKENVERALDENTDSINGYKVRPNCGKKNDIKILLNYSVIYEADPQKEFIYNVSGTLYQIAYVYPEYRAVYSNLGRLAQIIFPLENDFSCIFSGKGALQGIVDTEGNLYNRSGNQQNLEKPEDREDSSP